MKIRYYGHIAPTGFGRAAIEMCMALSRRPDVTLEIAPIITSASFVERMPETHLPLARLCKSEHELDPAPDVVIVHTLPWDCVRAHTMILGRLTSGGHALPRMVAYTTWEALFAPAGLVEGLARYDQVWMPSAVSARAFAGAGYVRVVPHCFDEQTLESRRQRSELDGRDAPSDPFRFYYLGAWTVRKNPAAVLRAYAHSFRSSDPVELVIQSSGANPTSIRLAAASTGLAAEGFPKLRIRTEPISDDDIMDLHRGADCFVTASHGEAWNLPAFDAMLAGRMVIAPHNLGSDEFLAETSAMVYGGGSSPAMHDVRIKPGSTDIEIAGVQGLSSRCLWVEPSMPALIGCMRTVFENRTRDITVNYDPRTRFGYERVAKLALQHLEDHP